jgi:hypothetical protein
MNFARTAKSRYAPEARIETSAESECGFLLLTSEKELVIYNGSSIRTLQREEVTSIDIVSHRELPAIPRCGRSSASDGGTGDVVHSGRE